MNTSSHSTAAPAAATSIDWSTVIDGSGGLYGHAVNIARMCHFLVSTLEFGLDTGRGRVSTDKASVDLTFQIASVDATMWLVDSLHTEARDLLQAIEAVQVQMDEVSI